MLPCKKRRATVTESVQQGDDQEGDDLDLESAVKPESDQLKDFGSGSLSWGPSHESAVCPELHSMQEVENQLSMEDPSLSSKMLTQHGNLPVLEAVDVAIPQEIALPSLESSHSLAVHIDKGRLPATGSKKAKKTAFQPGLITREDRGDHPVIVEPPSGEPGEEVKAEGEEQENGESDKRKKAKKGTKRKRDGKGHEQGTVAHDLKLDDMLDRTLEDGAKQHNLTAVNVRNILHEVITNEHVVAMMKAAISETEDMPLFEPKMTRSKLKEVVEKGVVIPTWNISPIKKASEIKQPPQFVDIHLEEDDSSDEEYQPDEEEEDETAEESLLESDVESTASSPRGPKRSRLRASSEVAETDEESGMSSEVEKVTTPAVRHVSAEVVPMGPPPPPKPKQTRDSAFMEKLNAVDEELASSPVCMDSFQPMEDSLIAFRTRSKMPLKDVPLGQLEAELQAPDITPDMYDPNTADDEDWKVWLGGLLNDDVENEDEADDDDDPEYNFLEDLDEPDTEDFRTDRAVRITKKEVNGLMEELFETFQDEMGFSNMEEDGPEEEERVPESRPDFNTPQTLRFEEPLANLLNERHRTVKELLEQLKMKKSSSKPQPEVERLKPQKETVHQTLMLDAAQRSRLQQQMQQHVQLLTQIYLLSTSNPNLSSEASTSRVFLKELGTFAENSIALHQQFNPKFQTLFQPCNWMGAMQLIEDFTHVSVDCSPHKTVKKTASEFPCLPKQVAWILATNKVFMYPELLPICSLKANNPRDKIIFTKAEDNLLALGLKHFEGTEFPKPLISKYLVTCKTAHQLTVRIKNLNQNRAPNNVIKFYKKTKQLPVLVRCCEETQPQQWKPPVEKEEHRLPFWLKASLQSIQDELRNTAEGVAEGANVTRVTEAGTDQHLEKACPELGSETRYPLLMPKGVVLKLRPDSKRFSRKALRLNRPLVQKPLLIQPSPCVQPGFNPGKTATWSSQSEVLPGNIVVQIPHLIQPATVLQTLPGFPSVAVSGEHSFESSAALPTVPSGPEARTSFPLSESQSPLPSSSAPKIMLPSLPPSKFQKPYVRRKPPRRKGTKVSPCVKPAPIIHPTPVIFTVPATTVKVVSLPSGCNVIQPVNAAVAPNPQTIPITTLLVNPTSFPCPLNQPLVASSISPLIVSSNPLTLPVPSIPEDKVQVNLDIAEGKNAPQNPDSTSNSQELTPVCATVFSKENPRPWCSSSGMESQGTSSELSACVWTGVKKESQETSSESSACVWTGVKTESQEGSSESSACGWTGVKTESQEGSSESSVWGWTGVKTESQEGSSESNACDWAIVKTESQEGSSESSACGWTGVKTESQEGSSESSVWGWTGVKMESQEGSSESSACDWAIVKTESQEGSSESSAWGWTGVKTESREGSSESSACGWAIVKTESQEGSSESSACDWAIVKTESQEGSSESSACGWAIVKTESQEGSSESSACGWTGVKNEEGGQALEPLPLSLQLSLNSTSKDLEEMVKMEAEDCVEEMSSTFPEQDIGETVKEEYSMELDCGSPQEKLSSARERRKETVVQTEETRAASSLSMSQELPEEGSPSGDASRGLPKDTPSSMEQEMVLSRPPGKAEDSAIADSQSVGTPAGADTGGEKDGPEEEEEEDFDDLTQDEEDELSSASEESVLSVPELQETMEKLTWLASERSMSQEGESEEENSQEENSEPEEEEEEEAEGMEALPKEDEVNDEAVGDAAEKPPSTLASPKTAPEVESSITPAGESIKAAGKGRSNHRARKRRGSRARASKDSSKLLLLFDEDILDRDPLREQKDLAFAQAYLARVREALQHVPGKYEDFLQVIYEFESSAQRQTAVDLYKSLQTLLQDWPQLLKDFAAFLLPEQALSCGLFEEQQAFEKSRRFLRQLEICFAENPSQHQKIIKVLQGCADCLPQDTTELKTQMWQLLKGHDHLQDEFSIFFDHLRPAASRMGDFEEINWTEEKEYEFDGFEEVILPDVEEEEEPVKVSTASKSKRRKDIGVQNHDKETEWPEMAKDCSCSCHEGGPDSRLKKSKRRNCHCSSKVCDSKCCKSKESLELVSSSPLQEASSMPGSKEAGQGKDMLEEEALEEQENTVATQIRTGKATRKGETPIPGSTAGSILLNSAEVTLMEQPLEGPTFCSPETPQLPPQTGVVLSVRRNQAGPDVVSCLGTSTILPEEGEDQKAAANSETTVSLPDASEAETRPGIVELPASSRTRDAGRRHICGKAGSQSWLLEGRVEAKTDHTVASVCGTPSGVDASAVTPKAARGVMAEDSGTQGKGPEGAVPKASEATVCANNSKVSSTGEKVVLWTREADRVILTMCQEQGAQPHTFSIISQQLGNKTPVEVSHRFRELMQLFHTACEASSEEEDDATSTSNADQLSDHGDLLSEEELDE